LGSSYNLVICPPKNDDGSPNGLAAEYHVRGYRQADIYLWGDLGEHIQRPLLFHELTETGFLFSGMEKNSAHDAALQQEKRFCTEHLSPSELEAYLQFRKDSGSNGFEPSEQ